MSRIGRQPIVIPEGVNITIKDNTILVKGPKGELKQSLPVFLKIKTKDNQLNLSVVKPEVKQQRALWGTFARLISNMIKGVSKGFEKKLELIGVGYRVKSADNKLILKIGFSHEVEFSIPQGIKAMIEQNIITISGIDKQLVGETAAQIRRLRKPEPYKGKGIKYVDEVIRKKAGKKAVSVTGG